MKKLIFSLPVSSVLLFAAACGNGSEETPEETIEAENTETDSEQEETALNEEETNEAFSDVSDTERDIIEQRYRNRTNDDFIDSIETQNDEYSSLVVYVNPNNIGDINEDGLQNKLEGIGTSIREMTSGILYDNNEGTLPLLEFRDTDDEVLGVFESHNRNGRMEFRP